MMALILHNLKKNLIFLFLTGVAFIVWTTFAHRGDQKQPLEGAAFFKFQNKVIQQNVFDINNLKKSIGNNIKNSNWDENLSSVNENLKIQFTINKNFDDYVKKVLKKYNTDYSTVVVIDNETGNIISASGYDGKKDQFNNELAFSNTNPSASIFKIITSAELLKNNKVDVDTLFTFRGRSTTLYKNQLRDTTPYRGGRPQSFRKAFAHSNNVIFAKAAIKNILPSGIYKMANDFGFNQQLMEEVNLGESRVGMPEDQYKMAQLASGFNDETVMSPVHGALLSSVIANDGVLKLPNLVVRVYSPITGETVWSKTPRDRQILDKETSFKMRELMSSTIDEGTARKGFRKMGRLYKQELEIGGKTGHITGGMPFGKRDWFTAFAKPKDPAHGKGISICVMNVNVVRWHIRSSAVAKEIIEHYYDKILPVGQSVTKLIKRKHIHREV